MLLLTASISPLIVLIISTTTIAASTVSIICYRGFCYFLSSLLVTIYCSYFVIYVNFYCQTQGKELFTCEKICACFLVFTLPSLRNLSKPHLLQSTEFEVYRVLSLRISRNLIFYYYWIWKSQNLFFSASWVWGSFKNSPYIEFKISQNLLFCWLSLRISQNFFYRVWGSLKASLLRVWGTLKF